MKKGTCFLCGGTYHVPKDYQGRSKDTVATHKSTHGRWTPTKSLLFHQQTLQGYSISTSRASSARKSVIHPNYEETRRPQSMSQVSGFKIVVNTNNAPHAAPTQMPSK
uniref:Uncharacterized protein n=1 Tax=Oryza punctata TaxID=4537 RepID=A0A0E0LYU3_ORYPU